MKNKNWKYVRITVMMFYCALLAGRIAAPSSEITEARQMILDGLAECVQIGNGSIYAHERGDGASPLLFIYENRKADMENAVVVDKVVGRAARRIG